MTMTSIGDASQYFVSRRNNTDIKSRLNTLTQELSTGLATDMSRHLGADRPRLAALDRSLMLLDRYAQAGQDAAQTLSMMQTTLGLMEDTRASMSSALVAVGEGSTGLQVDQGAQVARQGFETIVQSLNTRLGDRALFAGTATGSAAVASPAEMLTSLKAAVAGALSPSDVAAAVDAWFDDPAGGFATSGFLGQSGTPIVRPIGPGQSATIDVTANDPGIRDLLKAAAMAALAGQDGPPLALNDKVRLLTLARDRMFSVAQPLTSIQARLGAVEESIETAKANQAAQRTLFTTARNDLAQADPFDTAAHLQQVQVQLETHYTVTARLSRLTLAEYLR